MVCGGTIQIQHYFRLHCYVDGSRCKISVQAHFSTTVAPRIAAISRGTPPPPHFQRHLLISRGTPPPPCSQRSPTPLFPISLNPQAEPDKNNFLSGGFHIKFFNFLNGTQELERKSPQNYWDFLSVDFFVNLFFKVFSISTITSKTFTFGIF